MNHNHRHDPSHDVDEQMHKQIRETADQLQVELKRLNENPNASTGNATLYNSLAQQLVKIKEGVVNQDLMCALKNAADKLKNAEKLARNHTQNKDILPNLQEANAELFKSRTLPR